MRTKGTEDSNAQGATIWLAELVAPAAGLRTLLDEVALQTAACGK